MFSSKILSDLSGDLSDISSLISSVAKRVPSLKRRLVNIDSTLAQAEEIATKAEEILGITESLEDAVKTDSTEQSEFEEIIPEAKSKKEETASIIEDAQVTDEKPEPLDRVEDWIALTDRKIDVLVSEGNDEGADELLEQREKIIDAMYDDSGNRIRMCGADFHASLSKPLQELWLSAQKQLSKMLVTKEAKNISDDELNELLSDIAPEKKVKEEPKPTPKKIVKSAPKKSPKKTVKVEPKPSVEKSPAPTDKEDISEDDLSSIMAELDEPIPVKSAEEDTELSELDELLNSI